MTENQQAAFDLLAHANMIEPMKWELHAGHWDWTYVPGHKECPLTHAARVLLGMDSLTCGDWNIAAKALGIPMGLASRIVEAADEHGDRLRPCLLAVYGKADKEDES